MWQYFQLLDKLFWHSHLNIFAFKHEIIIFAKIRCKDFAEFSILLIILFRLSWGALNNSIKKRASTGLILNKKIDSFIMHIDFAIPITHLQVSWIYFFEKQELFLVCADICQRIYNFSDDFIAGKSVKTQDNKVKSDSWNLILADAIESKRLIIRRVLGFAQYSSFTFVFLVRQKL